MDENEEDVLGEDVFKIDGEDELDMPPEGMMDFGLDEEDPDKDK